MSETLTFGPEWLRALSSGNSVTSPPPSPGPKFKLAEFRYGKEEMLAMFIEEFAKPVELEHFASITKDKPGFPLAFLPPTEEEQRTAMGSVNSNAVLKLMGRGGTRGGIRGVRGATRGRGRGDGGFMRQSSYEDTRTEGGFGRDPRRQSWDENRRGGFEAGRGSGRGYDPTARPRLASDNSWDRTERDGDSWRSPGRNDEDDGGGWRVSGSRSLDKTDRWRGGRTTRGTWRAPDSYRREGSYLEDEWQVARSGRTRSWHERDEGKWASHGERLPEWSNDDQEDFDFTGTFDSSGAFRSQKKDGADDSKEERSEPTVNTSPTSDKKQDESSSKESVRSQRTSTDETKDEKTSKERLLEEKASTPTNTKSPSPPPQTDTAKSNSTPTSTTSQRSPTSTQPSSAARTTQSSTPSQHTPKLPLPSTAPKPEPAPVKPDSMDSIDHLEKAEKNLAKLLGDEDDDKAGKDRDVHKSGHHSPATTPGHTEEVQWYYTDPQGKQQGPFTNSEMADWFKHGYFTMNLMIRRITDEVFQPLGELIKSWGRVPFHPGPQPPPLKGIPEHIQQQQLLAQQQQYQDMMRQHLMQQQFLHQQAFMLQQQQMQQMQQQQIQQQQPPTPQDSSPETPIAPAPSLLQSPPSTQGESARIDLPPKQKQASLPHKQPPQQQQQRPQGLSVTSESIWGPSGSPQPSPGMISPGPWSPVGSPTTTVAAAKAWDVEASNKNKVQSLQEIQRIEEEKERTIKMEKERREAEARTLRQKHQEEEDRRRQQELLLQRQREEEERRQQHEQLEKKRREQEELLKKQQEEAQRKQEEELRRIQQKENLRKQQEQQRQQLEQQNLQQEQQRQQMEIQKRQQEEKQRMLEMRQQQQQALLRLQQQQQEMTRRKEIQQQLELQQKLQQKRQHNQVTNGSLWGSPGAPAAPSLAQIQQQQEERERLQRERHRLILEQQEREQQNRAAAAGWGDHAPVGPPPVKSLLEIQQEQSRQQKAKAQNQQLSRSQSEQLSRSQPQPSHNPLSSSVWGNNSLSFSISWASGTTGGVWGGGSKHQPPQQSRFMGLAANDADDDDDDEEEESFWDEAVKAATKANPPPQTRPQQQGKKNNNSSMPTASQKAQVKKPNRDEESVRRLFQQTASNTDEFTQWCDHTLRSMKATGVDIPTFILFLKEVESPYEIHDYVKSYVGDTKEAREFAKEFIERRKKEQQRITTSYSSPALYQHGNVWDAPANQQGHSNKTTLQAHQQSTGIPNEDVTQNNSSGGESAASKKKKKKKMQKVDPSILGFSVNAAERVNMGEIQTLEDNR